MQIPLGAFGVGIGVTGLTSGVAALPGLEGGCLCARALVSTGQMLSPPQRSYDCFLSVEALL